MRKWALGVGVLALLLAGAFAGETYYVSFEGDDAGSGSKEKPWKTLQAAVEKLKAGDTLVVMPMPAPPKVDEVDLILLGDNKKPGAQVVPTAYKGAVLKKGGEQGAPITIRAADKHKVAVGGGGEYGFCFQGSECQHVRVEGFEIFAVNRGVLVDGGAGFIEVSDCDIRGCRMGVKVGAGTDCAFRRLKIHDNKYGMHLGDKGKNKPDRMLVEDCEARNNHNKTKSAGSPIGKDNTDGFCCELGEATGIVFRRCFASGSQDSGFDIKPEDAVLENCIAGGGCKQGFKLWRGAKLVNCLSYGNGAREIQLAGIGKRGVELVNCTFVAKGNVLEADGPVKVLNCILVGKVSHSEKGSSEWSLAGPLEEDFNLLSGGADSIKKGQHSLTGEPKLVDPAKGDYHLQAGSPAIDTGTAAGAPKTDLDGKARPQGKGVDIGAYER